MKAKELRIGNWVQDEHEVVQYVYRLWKGGAELSENEDGSGDIDYEEDEIFGIPISEKWVIKLGFKDVSNSVEKHFVIDDFNWYSSLNEVIVELDNGLSEHTLWTDCKHVHELQNLFFALTGNELKNLNKHNAQASSRHRMGNSPRLNEIACKRIRI